MKKYLLIILTIITLSCSQKHRFELLDSDRTGITFINTVVETDSLHCMNFEYIYNGAGVGIVDLNNDGKQDIIFTGNQVAPRIYLNEGDFKFSDISSGFEDLDNGQWYSGITFTDINNDGWKDLYLTCTAYDEPAEKRKNRFFICQGLQDDGRLLFKDMAEAYGIADDSYSVHAAFFDYDLDGDLDLYLMNNWVNDRLAASYRPKQNDGNAVSNDDLYRNNGDGTFRNVTIEAGIIYEGFGLGLALGDVNKDGYPDIYVSNDYVSNDLLYINQQNGTFKNEIATYMSYQTKSSMGDDMADINNDGNPDMFTLDMMPEYYFKNRQTINGFAYIYFTNDAKYGYEHQFLRNMLHMHNGFVDGEMVPYSEVGQMLGIYKTEWSWSPLFADYDNDGDKDLVVANGYPRDMTDKDWTFLKVELYGSVASAQYVISKLPSVKAPNHAYENLGNLCFAKTNKWFDEVPSYSYGASFVDLDGDGDLDYVTNNTNDKAFIYKNKTIERDKENSHFLRIKLIGKESNPFAFGAKVELWSGELYQFQEHFLSRGYVSSVDPVVHFGLAEKNMVDSIKVTWPSTNNISCIRNIQANQVIEIDEKNSITPDEYRKNPGDPVYIFSRVDGVIDYIHQQNDFIDFHYSQNIIPHKFSQIGPRMQKGDLNHDGLEDIIVGSTNIMPTKVFLRVGNEFKETEIEGLTVLKEFSESDFAIIDVDNDGDNDIIALAGGYESRDENVYKHCLYENNNGSFVRTDLPIPAFSSSVVRPSDFDHDGDIDLFIGARIKVEMFPFAPDSWIVINDDGEYKAKSSMNYNLGMVTDAVWSDYDGDGWEDLLITREWNSVAFLKNLEGKRLENQDLPEIESMHGIWYSVTAGDFDKDGDPDYILGNLGENHRFTISDQYPLRIYAFDLDMNGTLDPISTAYWKDQEDVMREYPINYLDELIGQSPYFLQKYQTYTSFSYETIEDILEADMMKRVNDTLYVNTSSSYILWNNTDHFEWERLPRTIQVSPIKKMIVYDFNNDTYPDVLLAGNDHSYDIGTGFYDANKGFLLLSKDGQPLSDLKPPSQSGIILQGMVESLLFFDGDTPLIIAGFNREKAKAFYVNNPGGKAEGDDFIDDK
jgi:hypothetical protein